MRPRSARLRHVVLPFGRHYATSRTFVHSGGDRLWSRRVVETPEIPSETRRNKVSSTSVGGRFHGRVTTLSRKHSRPIPIRAPAASPSGKLTLTSKNISRCSKKNRRAREKCCIASWPARRRRLGVGGRLVAAAASAGDAAHEGKFIWRPPGGRVGSRDRDARGPGA